MRPAVGYWNDLTLALEAAWTDLTVIVRTFADDSQAISATMEDNGALAAAQAVLTALNASR